MNTDERIREIWEKLDKIIPMLYTLYNPDLNNGLFVDLRKAFDNHLKSEAKRNYLLLGTLLSLIITLIAVVMK